LLHLPYRLNRQDNSESSDFSDENEAEGKLFYAFIGYSDMMIIIWAEIFKLQDSF
jgi:hypothetical protein